MTNGNNNHKWFAMIPNMIDEMNLSPKAMRLYVHVKKVCGEDPNRNCTQGVRRMAKICNMGRHAISTAKTELEEAGLVTIDEWTDTRGRLRHAIRPINVWDDNEKYHVAKQDSKSAN